MGYCNQLWAELASEPSHMWADETNGMFHPLPASALAAEVQGRFTPASANQGRCDLVKYDVSHSASELTKSIQNAPMSSYSRPTGWGCGLGLSGLLLWFELGLGSQCAETESPPLPPKHFFLYEPSKFVISIYSNQFSFYEPPKFVISIYSNHDLLIRPIIWHPHADGAFAV